MRRRVLGLPNPPFRVSPLATIEGACAQYSGCMDMHITQCKSKGWGQYWNNPLCEVVAKHGPDFSDVLNWLRALHCVNIHQKICLKIGRFYKVKHQAHCEMLKPALLPVEFFWCYNMLSEYTRKFLADLYHLQKGPENKHETFDWPHLMAFKWSSTVFGSVFHLYESSGFTYKWIWESPLENKCWFWKSNPFLVWFLQTWTGTTNYHVVNPQC
jgi:hypothetical protein